MKSGKLLWSGIRLAACLLLACLLGGTLAPLSAAPLPPSRDGRTSELLVAYANPGIPESRADRADRVLGSRRYVLQTPSVSTGCFSGKLRGLVARLGRKFGKTPVVTSGYRHGRRPSSAKGRKRGSYHASCMAADVQIPGVAPSRVFAAARALPGRGGVGLYCHTRSIHVDVGPQREWSARCGRSRRPG